MTTCTTYKNSIQVRHTGTTNSVLESSPTAQAGIASALLNDSREVAGLLGITVIGAVLSTREGSALRGGTPARQAFIDGYHTGIWVAIGLLAAGVVLSYVSLRPRPGAPDERAAPPFEVAARGRVINR